MYHRLEIAKMSRWQALMRISVENKNADRLQRVSNKTGVG